MNEPKETSLSGYGTGVFAPGIESIGEGVYIVAHNQLRAHAFAYRLYQEEFAESQKGAGIFHLLL